MDSQWAAPWGVRRRLVIGTLLFCAAEVVYLTVWGKDTELHRAIVTSIILLASTTLGSYLFGATWDNKNQRDAELRSREPPRFPPRRPSPADDPPEGFGQ
jgi:hypothetical protein